MEYDKTASNPGPRTVPAAPDAPHTKSDRRGNVRAQSNPTKQDIEVLSSPITFEFSGKTAFNRLLKAPMTERLCHWNKPGEDISARGEPSDEYRHLYELWGQGQIGTIVFGNMMIRYDALEAFGNPILIDDHNNRVQAFSRVVQAAKANGSLAIGQLSHPGRQGSRALNPNPVSASDIQLKMKWAGNEFAKPRALTVPEIKEMVQWWANAADFAHRAGFDGVQVHCAHGYLLAQFLSPTTNRRSDEYGGSFENRSRVVFEVIEAIRERVRDETFIICVKLNSVEFQDKGTTPEEARELCVRLEQARVDFVDLSGGTFEGRAFHHVKESTKKREAYFIEFAELIRPLLKKTKVFVTGGLRTTAGMAKAIDEGSCDGVGIGRPLAAEPFLCRELLAGRISGAIENYMPLPLNTQASGTQLHQIGRGDKLVSDWSVEREVKRWEEANERETARKISILPVVDSSGYPPLRAEAGFAYLEVA